MSKGHSLIEELELPWFSPLPLISGGFTQTIAGVFWPVEALLPKEKVEFIPVEQDEEIALIHYPHSQASEAVVLVHGLNGSYESIYMKRLSARYQAQAYDVFCMNMRNCGPGLGRAKSTYHAGRSEDLAKALDFVFQKKKYKRIIVAGFSLGANIVLKCLGEGHVNHLPIQAVAISPPMDLKACAYERLQGGQGRFFDLVFSYSTFKEFQAMRPYLQEKPQFNKWHPRLRLRDLDELVTAKINRFENAMAYYEASSSSRVYDRIQLPTLILTSQDDPVVCPHFLLSAPENPNVSIVVTEKGGHVAFLDRRPQYRFWMDELILRWTTKVSGQVTKQSSQAH
jgi:predicted alpha/beta-fold hydrolase